MIAAGFGHLGFLARLGFPDLGSAVAVGHLGHGFVTWWSRLEFGRTCCHISCSASLLPSSSANFAPGWRVDQLDADLTDWHSVLALQLLHG